MKAIIIYHDLAFAHQAGSLLQRVERRENVHVEWTVKCWPVRVLDVPAMAELALGECLDAHLIVLPSSLGQSLPPCLLNWLKRWAAHRQIPDAALGILSSGQVTRLAPPLSPELPNFLRQHALNLIMDRGTTSESSVKLLADFLPEQEIAIPVTQTNYQHLMIAHRYRDMGINE
jgi:hypothetical protein